MPAFLERTGWRTYILRAGPEATEYGKPYTSSGTVRRVGWFFWPWFGRGRCRIDGYTRRSDDPLSNMQIYRDMQDCFAHAGYEEVHWMRVKRDGTVRPVIVKTRRTR